MSLMKYREGNQVKWVGSRPAHNGEQVQEWYNGYTSNTVLYTVPTGKTFYLTGFSLGASNNSTGYFYLEIKDTFGLRVDIMAIINAVGGVPILPVVESYFYPIELPQNYYFNIGIGSTAINVHAAIRGWVE